MSGSHKSMYAVRAVHAYKCVQMIVFEKSASSHTRAVIALQKKNKKRVQQALGTNHHLLCLYTYIPLITTAFSTSSTFLISETNA